MWISDVSIRRPVFAVMLVGAFVVLGWISLGRIGVDLFPRVEFPFVSVTTLLEGAAPETIETEVTDSMEEQVNTISGIESLRSISSEGHSAVNIEFGLDEIVDVKAQDVRDKVALAIGDLPGDADQPVVQKVDPDAQPIMSIMISGDMPMRELTRYADRVVKEQIQRVPGVGSIRVVGGRDREVRIWLDAVRLRAYGVTAQDVISAVRREHAEIPGGRLDTAGLRAEFSVKTKGEVQNIIEFGDIVVAYRETGPTRVRDVARVEDGLEDLRSYAELDGKPGVSLEVRRQSGRNTVEVAQAIRAQLAEIRKTAPEGVRLLAARDTSKFIEDSVNDVFGDIGLGLVLVVLVTLAFLLSVRATAIVAIAMPTALISTFFAFYVMGFTLNMMTLMALSVAVGLLVDDAIVILESIHRQLEEGHPPMQAAALGVRKVGLAVLSGSLSIAAVFVPIAFMDGIVGRFFFQYGLAIVFSVSVSLMCSLTLTPMLCARFLERTDEGSLGRIGRFFDDAYVRLEAVYGRILDFALALRWIIVLLAGATMMLGVFVAGLVPSAFDTRADRSEFLGQLELPFGAGVEQTREVASRAAAAIRRVEHVQSAFFTVGGDSRERVNQASFYVALSAKDERDVGFIPIMDATRAAMQTAAPEATHISVTDVPWISGGGFTNFLLEYSMSGPDLDVLRQRTDLISSHMRETGIFRDIKTSFEEGKPEVQVIVDRVRAADLSVPVRSLADTVRALVGGVDVATFEEFGQRYDVRVRLEEDQRHELHQLELIQVRASDSELIDLANLAAFNVEAGPAQIDRSNRSRNISIFANTAPGVAMGVATAEIERIIASAELPSTYTVTAEGSAKRMKETAAAIGFAFMLALVALYMILASQFNSFTQPLIIMLTAPLSFVGAFIAIYLAGETMTMFAQIGLLALMGLVMKNGILLVDYANQAHEGGMSAREAIREAGPVRLRPVLMTALSTICGMIPVAMSVSQGAEFRNGMGFLVIGGLTSSTALTLVVVPVAYTLMADARQGVETGVSWVKKTLPTAKKSA
ncbi:MAG: efflux RND transporter permease subunit [Candidatus Phaeomarinobacter sp.]